MYMADHLNRRALENELSSIAKRIMDSGGPDGIYREKMLGRLRLPRIPTVSLILDMLGLKRVNVEYSKTRHPARYEVFIADWFGEASKAQPRKLKVSIS
jgi:hypothetical protein